MGSHGYEVLATSFFVALASEGEGCVANSLYRTSLYTVNGQFTDYSSVG